MKASSATILSEGQHLGAFKHIYFFSVLLGTYYTAYFLTLSRVNFFSQVFLSFGQSIIELLCSSLIKDSKQYYFQQNFASAFTYGQSNSEILSFLKIQFHQLLVKIDHTKEIRITAWNLPQQSLFEGPA